MSPHNRAAIRPGLTLIEILVVIAIIGILMGLLIPAVQRIRESANQASCTNHLRQISIAAQSFHASHGIFPTNGTPPVKKILAKDGTMFTPQTNQTFPQSVTYLWPVADPKLGPRDQTGSWAYSLLPISNKT